MKFHGTVRCLDRIDGRTVFLSGIYAFIVYIAAAQFHNKAVIILIQIMLCHFNVCFLRALLHIHTGPVKHERT